MTPDNEPPGRKVSNVQLGNNRAISNSSGKNEVTGPKQKRCSVVEVSGGDRKVRAESVIFRARCPRCEPSTTDPEQAAEVSPYESDPWLRIQGLGLGNGTFCFSSSQGA